MNIKKESNINENDLYIERISDIKEEIYDKKDAVLDYLVLASATALGYGIMSLILLANDAKTVWPMYYSTFAGIETLILGFSVPNTVKIVKLKNQLNKLKRSIKSAEQLENCEKSNALKIKRKNVKKG